MEDKKLLGEINAYVSRYIIPFYYDYEENGYLKVIEKFRNDNSSNYKSLGLPKDCKWIEKGFWENYKGESNTQSEMEIYSYLLDLLIEDKNAKNEANLGTSFVMRTNGNILNLQYIPYRNSKVIDFKCTDLGVSIFRNGIGFIWYGVEFEKSLTSDEYIKFQHDFKELARTRNRKFRKKTGKDTYVPFCMGKWITLIMNTKSLEIRFLAERKIENNTVGTMYIPDKALLFQYLFVNEAKKEERMDLAFRIANGYDSKYNLPTSLEGELYEPFGNTYFYTSKSGTAYVVSNNSSNAYFFKNNFKAKFIRDYFFIYMLLLYQKYSCVHYSRLLTKLPADVHAIESDRKYLNLLESLNRQINLFLVKSVYESVSNVQHQNGLYVYGKKILRIEEDMNSLTVGLEALRKIEEERQKKFDEEKEREQEKKEKEEQELIEEKDRAINNGLIIFGFLVVISSIGDALSLVDWFKENTMEFWHYISLIVVAMITFFMVWVLCKNSWKKK